MTISLLGHSTIQITLDLYCHVTDDTLEIEMSKFELGANAQANYNNQQIGIKVV